MQDTFSRRQAILDVLSSRRFETMANLAYEFNVSVRTIQRDIDILSISAPIYTVRGNGGGVQYMEGQYSTSRYLSRAERDLLEKMLEIASLDDHATLQGILDKFSLPRR